VELYSTVHISKIGTKGLLYVNTLNWALQPTLHAAKCVLSITLFLKLETVIVRPVFAWHVDRLEQPEDHPQGAHDRGTRQYEVARAQQRHAR
jgi:hypothetical protein